MGISKTNHQRQPRRKPSPRRKTPDPANPLDELAEELALAVRLDRPSILFVVAESDALRERSADTLAAQLQTMGHQVETLDAAQLSGGDVPMAIEHDSQHMQKIFFIKNLEQGGEPTLRALNIRREYITELRARIIVWLTPRGEKLLAQQATDFWSFRDRTVYLSA